MTKPEMVKNAALQRVGDPYVYGGTGKTCTPAYRRARMAQYPEYADKIRANCPRLKGSAVSCVNCKWADPETGTGKECYDCAQLALACMAAAGIPLVSGANPQWLKTNFSEKGEISALPKEKVCLVFRRDSDGRMHHVGVYMGDGTVVHAKGHAYGVVHTALEDDRWTHYGVPAGLYDAGYPTLRHGNRGEYVKLMQQALVAAGFPLAVDGAFGKGTKEAVQNFQSANGLVADGVCGPNTWRALAPYLPAPEEPAEPAGPEPAGPDAPGGDPDMIPDGVIIDRAQLHAWRDQLEEIIDELDRLLI